MKQGIRTAITVLAIPVFFIGCKSVPAPNAEQSVQGPPQASPIATAYPARPTVPPPAFKVFHHDGTSVTLVTKENATNDEIESLIWELRDAAHSHSFNKLKIDQEWIDKRDPIIWFHIYRGAKCASEKYTTGTLPCGASYHSAGDFTFGGFTNREHDDGALLTDENHETHLWDATKPYTSPTP